MLRTRAFRFLLVSFLTLSLAGCNLVAKLDLARGQKAERRGDFAEAVKLYTRVLTRLPQSEKRLRSQVHVHVAECWLRMGNPNEAFAAFQKSVETDSSNQIAHLRLGEMY